MDVIPKKEDLNLGQADVKRPGEKPRSRSSEKLEPEKEPVAPPPELATPEETGTEFIAKVKSILEHVGICMVCTQGKNGDIESRPMILQSVDPDGSLWFFFGRDTFRMNQVEPSPHVTVVAQDSKGQKCVELRGPGKIIDEKDRLQPMWKLDHGAWFPGGLDDPQLALFRVEVREAAYWEWKAGLVATTLKRLEAILTGVEPADVVHERQVL